MDRSRAAEIWGLPAPRTVMYTMAVVSDDETLAERAAELLEREGLQIRLEINATGVEALEEVERRPTLVIGPWPHGRLGLDRVARCPQRRLRGALAVVVIASGDRV